MANDVPNDGVDDSRPPDQLLEDGAGDPWGDPALGDDDLIPGRDFDPADDPDDDSGPDYVDDGEVDDDV